MIENHNVSLSDKKEHVITLDKYKITYEDSIIGTCISITEKLSWCGIGYIEYTFNSIICEYLSFCDIINIFGDISLASHELLYFMLSSKSIDMRFCEDNIDNILFNQGIEHNKILTKNI